MTLRGRPRNLFGLTTERYTAWRMSRTWTTKREQLLREGSAVGMDLTNPQLRIEFTATTFDDSLFWFKAQAVDGKWFHSPTPLAGEDIPTLLKRWNCESFSWAEGAELAQATFKGTPPREFITKPGPFWYLTMHSWESNQWALHFDKSAFTTHAATLAVVMGPELRYLGETLCSKMPTLGATFAVDASTKEMVTEMYRGAAKWAHQLYTRDMGLRPFDSTGARNLA